LLSKFKNTLFENTAKAERYRYRAVVICYQTLKTRYLKTLPNYFAAGKHPL
jgi:hypothetical protein